MLSLDALGALTAVGLVTAVVALSAAPWLGPFTWVLAVWTALATIAALPAVIVLMMSPPTRPLHERSALVHRARWFGKAVWAAFLFGASIVLGTMTGVLASAAAPSQDEIGGALASIIAGTSSIALWPVLGVAAAVGYVWMVVGWLVDLDRIERKRGLENLWRQATMRWTASAQTEPSASSLALLDLVLHIGRLGLLTTAVTLGLTVAAMLTSTLSSVAAG